MIGLLLILHLVIGSGLIVANDRLGRRAFPIAALAPLAVVVWAALQAPDVIDGDAVEQRITWVSQIDLSLDLRLDAFALVMVALVSGIGLLICIYAYGYFSHAMPATGRLAGLMTLFAGSMLGVVLADHLLALFVFWELTSVTSYALIGNDDTDPRARGAALHAIFVTGAGGLAMLAGFILIGHEAGTYRLSEIIADPPSGGTISAALLCVLAGAFTKSAQLPFAGWLPGAMVAPTPVSAYLHSATMVKAGVYLVARLAPLFALAGAWRPLVLTVGAVTMFVGGWRALRQHDLKLLLAYGTVSQLGFMMTLLGTGVYSVGEAGVAVLLAHGAFKASLFMIVGIIDHQAHTRDVRKLHGFGRPWRLVIVVAVVSAASMAGIPPLLGFIAKEKGLDGLGDAGFSGAGWVLVAVVLGSILTFAYSSRFVLGVIGRLGDPDEERVSLDASPPATMFVAPAVVLTAFTVIAGLAPVIVSELIETATVSLYPGSHPHAVELFAGFNAALALSAIIIVAGAGLVVGRRQVTAVQDRLSLGLRRLPNSDQAFAAIIRWLNKFASRLAAIVQNGSLPTYLAIILAVAALGPLIPALSALDTWPDAIDAPIHVPIAALIIGATIGSTLLKRRIAAALMLGAVGYAMAGFYVSQGAPDLALTQFAIETLSTVLFVLVMRFLPRRFTDRTPAVIRPLRIGISALVGATVFVLAIVASGARSDVDEASVSGEMVARAEPDAHGHNVVNVILVDFRGLDTLGEITVLVVAALGVVALARLGRRPSGSGDRT